MSTQKLPISEKNFQAAQKFLDIFEYGVTTIQMMQDKKIKKVKSGKHLWNGKKGSSVCAFEGKFEDFPELQDDIISLQNQGFSLWFMVNEGDGEVADGKDTERSQASVRWLTACFVDTDEGDVKRLDKFCRLKECHYQLRVNTSPGKYHCYFLLERVEATPDNILKWEAIQRALMAIDKRFDRSMADHSRVLRVPFFFHNKGDPFLIKLQDRRETVGDYYELDDLYELVGAEKYVRVNGQGDRFEYPSEKIDSGNRHYSLVAYLRSMTARCPSITREELVDAGVGFARRNFTDFKLYMPNGERYGQLEHNVESVLTYQRQEEEAQQVALLDEVREKESKEGLFYPEAQFFYDCPNTMIGEMLKHSSSQALYPCPAFDFAAIMCMLGCLKSHLFKSSRGHPPVNYFLCFGPPGSGKNHSQVLVGSAMRALGEKACYFPSLKTEKGLYRALSENNSRVLAMMDEIEDLLTMMTSNKIKVEAHTKTLKTALLHLYTSYNKEYRSAPTGNMREKPFELPNVHLNLIGYGTPEALNNGFSLRSLTDGLFPRFNIIGVADERKRNPKGHAEPRFTQGQLEYIREVVMAGKGVKEEHYMEIEELEEQLEELQGEGGRRSREDKARIDEITEKIRDLRCGGRVIGKAKVIPFTDKASKQYDRFIDKMDQKYNQLKGNPLRSVYTRVAEKVGRFATVIADREITTKILDWCIEWAEKQADNEIAACGKDGVNLSGSENWEERQYQRLMRCMANVAGEDGVATKRDISRHMRIGAKALEGLIKLGLEREEIDKVTEYRKGDHGKKGAGFRVKFDL